jgi:D-alanyl-D-alanine carboxypeptidase (penicillin-binding protein 5/6)
MKIKNKTKKTIIKIMMIFILSVGSFLLLKQTIATLRNNKILKYPNFDLLSSYKTSKKNLGEISSNNYLIYDVTEGKDILSKNKNEIRPLASITKVMTAIVAMENCQDFFTVDGEEREKEDIIKEMLVISSNELAEKIAANCPNTDDFVYLMNRYAIKNNLNLTFKNASGLDIENETVPSALGDAESIAKLLILGEKSIKSELDSTTQISFDGKQNTNNFVEKWPFLVASKTGFTDTAGGNLVTMFEPYPGKRIIIVVLGSTKDDRFTDTQKLFDYFINNK